MLGPVEPIASTGKEVVVPMPSLLLHRVLPIMLLAAVGFAVWGAPDAAHAALVRCPQAHTPYSVDMPIFDVLLDPSARAAVEAAQPGLFGKIPAFFQVSKVPSFGTIITLRVAAQWVGTPADAIDRIDAAVKRVRVTRAASRLRCARYDADGTSPPVGAVARPAVLIFDKINGFRDTPSVEAADKALDAVAARRGWTVIRSRNGSVFNARDLARFDAVIWNNISGDVLTVGQRKALRRYVEQGGGFVGIHGSNGDPYVAWNWYADGLIGARFIGHPDSPQFQEARVVVDDPASAIVAAQAPGWTMTEEWYSFAASPRASGAHILLRLDESTYNPKGFQRDLRMGDHPIAWTRCVGNGRSFYSAIGHRTESYVEPHAAKVLEEGIAWAMGRGTTKCHAEREVGAGARKPSSE